MHEQANSVRIYRKMVGDGSGTAAMQEDNDENGQLEPDMGVGGGAAMGGAAAVSGTVGGAAVPELATSADRED